MNVTQLKIGNKLPSSKSIKRCYNNKLELQNTHLRDTKFHKFEYFGWTSMITTSQI